MVSEIATRNGVQASVQGSLTDTFLRGRKATTIAAYAKDLEDFRQFVGASTANEAVSGVIGGGNGRANEIAHAYRAHLLDRNLSAATVNRRLAALRSVVKLARTLGYVAWTLEVEGVRSQSYRDTRGPGSDVISAMIRELRKRADVKAVRDEAIVRCLYDLALRRGEVASLDIEHIDIKEGLVSVLGKGRTERVPLTLPDPTRAALTGWLAARGATVGPLFIALDRASHGHRITGLAIWKVVRALGLKVGATVRPHGLRHSAITKALDVTGGDVRKVQRFSRHKDLRVLTVYDDARHDLAGEVATLVAEEV